MKVEIVSRKLIKPSTSPQQSSKNYRISFMDELIPTMNLVAILYYQEFHDIEQKIHNLEQSLANILPQFYPFSGRYIEKDHVVTLNDLGAQFVQAQAHDHALAQILDPESKIKVEELNDLLPCDIVEADEETDPILSVQITKFKCGGISIGVTVSHRIGDACSLAMFILAWSRVNKGDVKVDEIRPSFDGPAVFPGKSFPTPKYGIPRKRGDRSSSIVARKFVFDRNVISRMRERCTSFMERNGESVTRQPSRVQLVFGLIVKAFSNIDPATNEHQSRGLVVGQAINIRERTVPKLPKDSCGNFVQLANTDLSADETRSMRYEDFVRVLGNDARKTVEIFGKIIMNSEEGHEYMIKTFTYALEKSMKGDIINHIFLTDWSKFGFYNADFGWGKPIWTSVADVAYPNHVLLLSDNEGGGIEAWVQLEEREMAHFEQDELLGMFAK